MKEKLTILFPLLAALGVLFWFLRWAGLHRAPRAQEAARLPDEPAELPPEPAEAPGKKPLFTRRDGLVLALITLLYGAAAFLGLGDTQAPQSFLHFPTENLYALVELDEPTEISAVRYYCGVCTGDYRLEFSLDGETWTAQLNGEGNTGMDQAYTRLLRWNDATLNKYSGYVRYVRVVSCAELYLGELALYDESGNLIPADAMTVAVGSEPLFDEQDVVPAESSYLNGSYFDEIYHARTAYEHILKIWPYEITHPPLGKLILGLGIRLFGMTPFGWRFAGTLVGVLMLPALYLFLKKLFGSTAVAACGTLVFAFDFMHYTQTRLATIDSYIVFFTLLMYLFMYFWLAEPEGSRKKPLWLALAGVSFGLGAASKWTGFYAGLGLALLWLLHWVGRFADARQEGTLRRVWLPFAKNVGWCCLFFLAVPAAIYYASYYPYGAAQGMSGFGMYFQRDYLRLVLDNQSYMWRYHSDLVATHPYSSTWYQWLLDAKPILYYLNYFDDGTKSAFAAFNNPLLSWGGLLAVGAMAVLGVRERDKKALFILLGYLVNLLPWVPVSRLTFAYHYFPCTIFLTLALAWLFNDLRRRDPRWRRAVYGFTAACILLFAAFYPVLSGVRCSQNYTTYFLKWFPATWPF